MVLSRQEIAKITDELKRQPEGLLHKYIRHLQAESLIKYKSVATDHRYYQSQVQVLDGIVDLFPKVSK